MNESPRDTAIRESLERITASAVRFLDQFPDWTVAMAWYAGTLEETILYGVPNGEPPARGILGCSPLTPPR